MGDRARVVLEPATASRGSTTDQQQFVYALLMHSVHHSNLDDLRSFDA